MEFFDYVSSMKELDSPVGTAALIVLALFLFFIIIKMLNGMKRGTWRQVIRTVFTLISAGISYMIATWLTDSIIGMTNIKAIEDLIPTVEEYIPGSGEHLYQLLEAVNPTNFESIILLPAALILIPLLTTVIFLIVHTLLKIVRSILIRLFRIKKARRHSQRLGGAIFGAVEAIIWVIMFTLPLTALLSLATSVRETINPKKGETNAEICEFFDNYVDPFAENPAYVLIDSLGSSKIADGIATVTVSGEDVNVREEVVTISEIIFDEIPNLEDMDPKELTEENKKAISSLIDKLCESTYVTNLTVSVLHGTSDFLEMDILDFEREGDFEGFVDSVIVFLEDVDVKTLQEDLETLRDVYFVISDSGVLKELEEGDSDFLTILQDHHKNGDDSISAVIDILQANDRTRGIVKSVTDALISSLSTSIEVGGVTVEVSYDSVKESMNEVLSVKREHYLTEEDYMNDLSNTLDSTLKDNGIEIEKEVVDTMAEYMDKEYIQTEKIKNDSLNDEQFTDILLNYYDAYLEYLENGGEVVIPQ